MKRKPKIVDLYIDEEIYIRIHNINKDDLTVYEEMHIYVEPNSGKMIEYNRLKKDK